MVAKTLDPRLDLARESVREFERTVTVVPRLHGRDDEQARLRSWVTAVGSGHPTPVLIIEGSPGIGKSRLVDEIRRHATDAGLTINSTACDPIERDRPFAAVTRAMGCDRHSPDPVRRALADRCRDLFAEAVDMSAEVRLGRRFGIQDDLVDLLVDGSESAGQLLIIDDAQWLDPFASAAIVAIVRNAVRCRIGVVLARRLHPCPLAVEELLVSISDNAEVIRLGPLDDDAVAAITHDIVGHAPPHPLPPRLAQAGGSPFAVLAVLSATWSSGGAEGGLDSLPGTSLRIAGTSTLARIRAHGERAEDVLRWAAVLGIAFSPDQVARLARQPLVDVLADLTRLVDDGVVRSADALFEFSHDLITEFLYESISLPVRLAMHREVARRAGELRLRPNLRAHHLLLAAEPGDAEAVSALVAAAEDIVRHDPEHALRILSRAEELSEGLLGSRIEIALRRADALAGLCRVPAAIEVIDAALLIADSADDVVRLRSSRARCWHQIGEIAAAADERELLARSGALDAGQEAAAWADVATYRLWAMQGGRPVDAANRAIELVESSGAAAPMVQAHAALGAMAAFDGDVSMAIFHADRARERGVALAPHVVVPSPPFIAGLVRLLADDVDESVRILLADQVRIERLGDPLMAARPATAAVIGLYLAGRWEEAMVEAEALNRLGAETGLLIGRLTSQVIGGLIAHHRGDDLAADEALAQATTAEAPAEGYAVPFLLQLQAARAEAAGDLVTARRVLSDLSELGEVIAPAIAPWFALDLVRLVIQQRPDNQRPDNQRPDTAQLNDETLAQLAARSQLLADRSTRASAHAVAALAGGLRTANVDELRASVGWWQRCPLALHRSVGLELAGIGLRRAGCETDARSAIAEALALAHSLGAVRCADRIGDLIHGRGLSRPRRVVRPSFGWEALSPAEISVLRLVTDGHRNRQIADALIISKRTVESHVSSMLMKLAVDTRVALARIGAEHLD